MCPLKYFRILFTQMCLLQTQTKLICDTQVSFAATSFKILIQEEAENTGFSTKTRKINMEDQVYNLSIYALLCSRFTFTQFILDLCTFIANSALSRLRAFWGALLAKIWWEGAQKHFIRTGDYHHLLLL